MCNHHSGSLSSLPPVDSQLEPFSTLPFSTTSLTLAVSNVKLTSEDEDEENEECNGVSNAVIPLVEDAACNAVGEALQLYDFGQRDERDGHNYQHHIKHHLTDGMEGSSEIREDGSEALYESGEEDEIPAEINVKKETSV